MGGKSLARQAAEQEAREAVQVAMGTVQSRYVRAFDRRAHGYALLGHTNEEIAELIGVDRNTFTRWTVEHGTLAKALHKARYEDNLRVVKALHSAARGYKHRETKLNVVNGSLVSTVITKAYPPSVQAATLILANRAGSQWKDTKTVNHTGRVDLAALVQGSMGEQAKVIEAKPLEPSDDDE